MTDPTTLTRGAAGVRVGAFGVGPVNPLSFLGDAASAAVTDGWRSAMVGLWSAGLWLLRLAFSVVDAVSTPDLSARGPLGPVLPSTLWVGSVLAVVLMFAQLGLAVARRDGRSLGRVVVGIAQFGFTWVAFLGVAGALVAAAAGLQRGLLESMLHVNDLHSYDVSASWPRQIDDAGLATVLGLLSLILVIPAAFFYLIIALVRAAALIILAATSPITAAGLLSDVSKTWFWKSLRWFTSCLLISPTTALVLGIGERVSVGVVAGAGDSTSAAAGTAVVGAAVIAVGACCPLVLFRLLAFVDPGTASGAALRQSWSDAGGLAGLTQPATSVSTGGPASSSGPDGRSAGEAGADSQTASRLSGLPGAAGPLGQGLGTAAQTVTSVAQRVADVAGDVLGQAGVGAPAYSMTPTDERSRRTNNGGDPTDSSQNDPGNGPQGGDGGTSGNDPLPEPPDPPAPPPPTMPGGAGTPGSPLDPGAISGPGGPAGPGGGAGAGAGAGEGAAAAAVAL